MKTESKYAKITSEVRSLTSFPPKNLLTNAKPAATISQYTTMKKLVDARMLVNQFVKESVAMKLVGWSLIVRNILVAVAY